MEVLGRVDDALPRALLVLRALDLLVGALRSGVLCSLKTLTPTLSRSTI